jgi:glycosyltransferase involved in cell wall biosynthesis
MKIMMVTPYFYPKIGGLENYALNIAKGLKNDHTIVVVTSNHESNKLVIDKVEGMKVYRLPAWFKVSNTPINPLWYFQIKRIIKDEKPDVINAHTPVPFIADIVERARGRIPFVLTYQNDLIKSNKVQQALVLGYYWILGNKTLRNSENIIASSGYYAENSPRLKKYQPKLEIVSPGIDVERFNSKVDKQWLKKKYPGKKIVLFVSSLDKTHAHKGLDVLIKAVAQAKKTIPNMHLIVAGKGDATPSYQALAMELGITGDVSFPGFVEDKDLPRYYAGADVLALPSVNKSEGFGMVLVEAMACGTPVIGTAIGGITYVLNTTQGGVLVKPYDIPDLAAALTRIINTDDLHKRLSDNGSKAAREKFTWKSATKETQRIFQRAEMPRICLVHNIISPYRLPLYEEINKHVNFTVLFCAPITKDRTWSYDLSQYTFGYKVLTGFSIGPVIFNTNALSALLSTRFDIVMANSDPDIAPTALLAFLLAKIKSKKILIWSLVTDENIHFFPAIAYSNQSFHKFLRQIISWFVMFYRRLCFSLSNHFLALTGQAQTFLEEHEIALDLISRTIQVMPLELLPEPNIKKKRSGRTFLYIGYLNERKGVNYLIDAFKSIPDKKAELIIAGSGPVEKQLKAQAKDDKRVKFYGYLEGVEKANLYASADVFVLPTLNDVWGLVINEAIRYGLAVICSDAAEAKELVSKDVGRVFHTQDVDELYKQMSQIINDQPYLKSMQANNLRNSSVSDTRIAANGYVKAMKATLSQTTTS